MQKERLKQTNKQNPNHPRNTQNHKIEIRAGKKERDIFEGSDRWVIRKLEGENKKTEQL